MKSKFTPFLGLFAAAVLLAMPPLRAADPVPPIAPDAPAADGVTIIPAELPPVAAETDAPKAPAAPKASSGSGSRTHKEWKHRSTEPDVRVGQNFELNAGETTRDIVVVGGDARIDGTVDGDLVVVLGKVTLGTNAHIKGSLVNVLGKTKIGADSKVDDELVTVLSNTQLDRDVALKGEVHIVGGKLQADPTVKYAHTPEIVAFQQLADAIEWLVSYIKNGPGMLRPIAPGLGWVWLVAGGFFLFRMLVTLIAHKPVAATASVLADRPLMSLLAGILTILLIGPVAALLSFTVIGPLALFFAYWIAGIIGTAGVYCLVGQQLGRLTGLGALQNLLLSAVVGTVVIYGAYSVPILGFLVFGIVWLLSIGGAVMAVLVAMQDRKSARQAATAAAIAAAAAAAPAPVRTAAPVATGSAEVVPAYPVMQASGAAAGVGIASGSPSFTAPPPITDASLLILPKAGFWIRVASAFLDIVLVSVVGGFIGAKTGPGLMMLFWLAYFIGMIAWKGTTIGGIICGLKVVRTDGAKMTPAVAVVRGLSAIFSVLVFFLGFFWIGWSSDKQGWHDVIAGTFVVRVPRSQSLL